MNLDFDLEKVTATDFGVGRSDGINRNFSVVMAEKTVQDTLLEMVRGTQRSMEIHVDSYGEVAYSVSEKYASKEYVYLSTEDELAVPFNLIHSVVNLPIDSRMPTDMEDVFCYFAHFTDGGGKSLTALRRSAQFKGFLKKDAIIFDDGSMKLYDKPLFPLNTEFDVLIDSHRVHAIHPASFKNLGEFEAAVSGAVVQNLDRVSSSATFVNWDRIREYATQKPRAAALLTSIVSEGYADNLDSEKVVGVCERQGVEVRLREGKIEVEDEYILGFLELIDRRLYEVDMSGDDPEHYRASSRRRVR